jgi:hypothetical protein
VDVVQRAVLDLQSGEPAACLNPLNHVSPQLKRLLEAARTTAAEDDRVSVCSFVLYLCDRVTSMHSGDRAAQAPSPVPGSYNPPPVVLRITSRPAGTRCVACPSTPWTSPEGSSLTTHHLEGKTAVKCILRFPQVVSRICFCGFVPFMVTVMVVTWFQVEKAERTPLRRWCCTWRAHRRLFFMTTHASCLSIL